MQTLPLTQIQPRVRLANFHQCGEAQHWGPRRIIDLQFIYVLRGQLGYQAGSDDVVEIQAGSVLCIFPTATHNLWVSAQDTFISGIHCELGPGTWASRDYRCDPRPAVVTTANEDQQIAQQFKLCADIYTSYGTFSSERCNAICKDILLGLGEHWQQRSDPALSMRMLEMIRFIREHLTKPDLSRQDLAAAFYVTPEHINYIFKNEVHMTPSEVINRERCIYAHQLLTSGLSVKETAHKVGFNDPLFFSRVFKKYFQVPPSKV